MTKQFQRNKWVGMACLALLLAVLPFYGCKNNSSAKTSDELVRAKKLIAQGNFSEAFMQLNQALAEAPRDPNVHLNLGWLYLYTNDLPNARKELAVVESLGPDLAETYHLRGYLSAYTAQQKKSPEAAKQAQEAAVADYQQALARDEGNYQTYFDLASSLSALERYQDALDVLDKGFDHIPQKDLETQVNFEIASCAAHARLQLFDEAIADCNQALEFTTRPESKERIEEMIENMKLMNPKLDTKLSPAEAPPQDSKEAHDAQEHAVTDEGASD
jgi:tetratricopeptide (TPR) repeat protein